MLIKADIKLFAHHIDSLISGVIWHLQIWTWRNATLEFIHARVWSCISVDPDQMLPIPLLTSSVFLMSCVFFGLWLIIMFFIQQVVVSGCC